MPRLNPIVSRRSCVVTLAAVESLDRRVFLSAAGGSVAKTPVPIRGDGDDTIGEVKTSTKNVVVTGGQVLLGLDGLRDVDLVRYVARAGETIGFDLDGRNGASPDTYLRLFQSDGTPLASNNDGLATGETGPSKSAYLKYTFVAAGTYYVGVSLNPNTAYSPATGGGDVDGVGPVGDYTLLAGKLGTISGTVFRDADGDGIFDGNENGLSGVTLYFDYDNDAHKDADETSVITDFSGHYAFTGVAAGTWKVRQVLPGGYAQTSPTNGYGQGVTLAAGQSVTGRDFGDKSTTVTGTASIAGQVFRDTNANGVLDGRDGGLSGWTVYVDADNDGVFDPFDSAEKHVTTDASGHYQLTGLVAGTYKVRVVKQTNFTQTTPTNGFGQTVTLTSGQAATGRDFGEQESGHV